MDKNTVDTKKQQLMIMFLFERIPTVPKNPNLHSDPWIAITSNFSVHV